MRASGVLLLTLAALSGCGGLEGPSGTGTGSVQGAVLGGDFTFDATRNQARVLASGDSVELTIELCEGACPGTGEPGFTRALTLTVHGQTADLRAGATFAVGTDAAGLAQVALPGGVAADSALSGEIVIDSSDLRPGGSTAGTFQLGFSSRASASGFFDAVITDVSGPVVVLGSGLRRK